MPEGGHILIETVNRRIDTKSAKERDISPGDYVCLTVSDAGTGKNVTIYLPRNDQPAQTQDREADLAPVSNVGQGEAVLIIDD